MSPLVSIVIVGRNCAPTIKRAVDSVLSQDFTLPYEIVFVDGDSTDNSVEIVKNIAKTHQNVRIVHEEKHSPAWSRIHGIKEAKGEFICFSDADDWYRADMVRVLYEAITATESDVVNCSLNYVRKHRIQKNRFVRKAKLDRLSAIDALFGDVYMHGFMHTKIYRASTIKSVLFLVPDYAFYCEDTLMNFQVFKNSQKVMSIKDPLYYYDKSLMSFTNCASAMRTRMNVDAFALIRYIIDLDGDKKLLRVWRKHHLRRVASILTDAWLSRKNPAAPFWKSFTGACKELRILQRKKPIPVKGQGYSEFIFDVLAEKSD